MDWNDTFMELFHDAVERYHGNSHVNPLQFFYPSELEFLTSIGYKAQEMFDYIADYAQTGQPSPSTTLLIASKRRTYFFTAQRAMNSTSKPTSLSDLPSPEDDFGGYVYMPHIIGKAEAKLRGTLDDGIMYSNARDRQFFEENGGISPADFLGMVNNVRGDRQKLITAIIHTIEQLKKRQQEP
ncbi:MAG: hypothetical protein R3Y56_02915 [Akkermansia sp.]